MRRTRRQVLGVLGTGALAGIAGCSGTFGGTPTPSAGCELREEPTVSSLPAPVAGDPDADVTVTVFDDFSCPHCRDFNQNVYPELRSQYIEPGEIRYEHADLPIPVNRRWSWWVASAARGVQENVGDEAFFTFASRAFANQGSYSLPLLGTLAAEVGGDSCGTQIDAANETYRPVLEADKQRAGEIGVRATPGIVVNGDVVDGNSFSDVSAAIESATGE